MLEISSVIIGKVESKPDSMDYFYVGILFSTVLAFLPVISRIINISTELTFRDVQFYLDEVYANVESGINGNCTVLTFYGNVFGQVLGELRNYTSSSINGRVW